VTPLLFTVLGFWLPASLAGESGSLALFVAFAVIYPEAPMFFNLMAKWVAAILVGLYTLMALSGRDWTGLISLWATTGFAFSFVRWKQGRLVLPEFKLFEKKPKLHVLPDLPIKVEPKRAEADPNAGLEQVMLRARSTRYSTRSPSRASAASRRRNGRGWNRRAWNC